MLLEPNGVCCQSEDGFNWKRVNATVENYTALGFGYDPITKVGYFVTVDSSSNTTNISTGARAIARAKVDNTTLTSISMIQPGSGYI